MKVDLGLGLWGSANLCLHFTMCRLHMPPLSLSSSVVRCELKVASVNPAGFLHLCWLFVHIWLLVSGFFAGCLYIHMYMCKLYTVKGMKETSAPTELMCSSGSSCQNLSPEDTGLPKRYPRMSWLSCPRRPPPGPRYVQDGRC